MKRLFQVVDVNKHTVTSLGFFDTKAKAKEARNAFNTASSGNHFQISKGPDHRLYRK